MTAGPILHLTNGDVAAQSIGRSGLGGSCLPWRDVLTDGPVPALDDTALRSVRANFLGSEYEDSSAGVDMAERDRLLAEATASEGEIVLWFEHDLYDQLQILQVMERFDRMDRRARQSL